MSRRLFAACLAAALGAAGSVSAATVQVTATSTPDSAFIPRTVTIRVGDTVRWTNVDGFHNVVADDDSWTSGSPTIAPWTFSRTFTTTGTVGYNCSLHGSPGFGMFGTVIVLDSIELGHGSQITEDLNGVPDLYRIGQKGYSSYEVVVDPVAGNPALTLSRVDGSGSLIQPGLSLSAINMSQSLRWPNTTAADVNTERVRVSNASCGTACSPSDVYALRAYETTLAIPRYNQTGTQSTVVVLQNPTSYGIAGTVYFWNATGGLVSSAAFTVAARGAFVLAAGSVANVPGTSGTLTIAHNGRYGDLTGKAVAIEPATGFTFDTPAVSRAR
jgi:plastocyanin